MLLVPKFLNPPKHNPCAMLKTERRIYIYIYHGMDVGVCREAGAAEDSPNDHLLSCCFDCTLLKTGRHIHIVDGMCDCVMQDTYHMLDERKLGRACKASRASHTILSMRDLLHVCIESQHYLGTVHFWKR